MVLDRIFFHQHAVEIWILTLVLFSVLAIAGYYFSTQMQRRRYQDQLVYQDLIYQSKQKSLNTQCQTLTQDLIQANMQAEQLRAKLQTSSIQSATLIEKLNTFELIKKEKQQLQIQYAQVCDDKNALVTRLQAQQARFEAQLAASNDKMMLLENAEKRLQLHFEDLANRVFDEKRRLVDEQNRQSLDSLLTPLKIELAGFRQQVHQGFGEQAKERHTLIHEIKNLQQLHQTMTREAANLTQALRGDNKQQGHWGEMILSRLLEKSGLREGIEYQTQVSLKNTSGKRAQPDVIVKLPQGRDVIIDAKMTLVAYERYYHGDNLTEQTQALDAHIAAIRAHIRGLSRKDYQALAGVESLDYVLLFIPIEPAFQLAIEADPNLIQEAFSQNIMLVSPTTLMVALRTISNLWRDEQQHQNAAEIARQAAKLYDKVRLFTEDMEQLGHSLTKANQSYQQAFHKLTQGRGNILRQTESFRTLGVSVKKNLKSHLLESD